MKYSPEADSPLTNFRANLVCDSGAPAIHYFDTTISRRELDELSDAFSAALLARGIRRGDRVALYLQNIPQFVIAMLGTWKLGGIVIPVNPMYREQELASILRDGQASALVCLRSLFGDVAKAAIQSLTLRAVITTSGLDFQTRGDPRILGREAVIAPADTLDMMELLRSYSGQAPPRVELSADDVALLTYTSGTTGPAKGAMNTHGNLVYAATVIRDFVIVEPEGPILGLAPLFHITGLLSQITTSLLAGMPLVLTFRYEAESMLDAIREHRPTFAIGAITAFIALKNSPTATKDNFASLRCVVSGGAPVPTAVVDEFEAATGQRIHNAYGLTETTAVGLLTPRGVAGPVDPQFGALAVGVPPPGIVVRVADEAGADVDVGELGEILVRGPQVVPGYWNQPTETEQALGTGWLKTGDVGFMDAAGWFFVVDRKKDQINSSGYKVWPREVEDTLYQHPAVSEAAVVGIADSYRGEAVKAVVTLKSGGRVTPQELIAFAKTRLSAYKCPRVVEIVEELPKTASGKILRRELRTRT